MKTKKAEAPALPRLRKPRVFTKKPAAQAPEILNEDDAIEESEEAIPDGPALEIEERLNMFHEKFGQKEYKIRIEKFNKEENDWEIVDSLKLDGFDPFSSVKKYGGGRYRLSLLTDKSVYVAGGRMEIRIAEAAVAASSPAQAPDNAMSLMIASLQAQNAQNLELMKAMIGRPLPPESKGPSLTELIAAMSGLRNLTPKDDGGMGGIKGTLELMKLFKDIMPEPAEEKSGLIGEVNQAVELFNKVGPLIAARRGQAPPRQPQPTTPAPANYATGVVVPAGEVQPTETESPMKPVIDKAKSYVPQLIAWAQRGKDVDDAADFVLDEVENEIIPLITSNYRPGGIVLSRDVVWNQLLSKAQDPSQVAALFTVVPELVPYRKWFEAVLTAAVAFALDPDGEQEPAPSSDNSNA